MANYQLRATLVGHESDVRGVAASSHPVEGIVSVSRDQSCRVWVPAGKDFIQELVLYGHSKYVSSVCVIKPSDKHPQGLIITGGHDNLILVYDFQSAEPILTLIGHSSTVCSLDAGNYGTILSGSWDKTARVWINGKEVMNLKGHEAAVWSVKMLPDKGLMLSGSADKTIKLWKAGKCEKTFVGHTDCVRSLAVLNPNEFLSSSNDGTIRRWNLNGDCLHVYEGHSNYIYSIALIPGTERFVSSGEDRSIRIWKDGQCEQTIAMPCQSIWCVTALENGDICAGSSDGFCRVFTEDEGRKADQSKIKEYEESVANQAIPAAANLDLGEIKADKLPGPEGLLQPGTRQDQTRLIRRDGVVEAYQWDAVRGEWKKVGEVTGAAGKEGSQRTSGKSVYEGKEYDHVIDVGIQDGVPPLKLPFNITDDPFVVAQKFLEKNEISQGYLEEVANFIIKNIQGVVLEQTSSQYGDPFTGGNRYVPGSNAGSSGPMADPFTGQGRYIPGGSQATPQTPQVQPDQSSPTGTKRYFPETNLLKFTSGKHEQISGKIREFNGQVQENKLTDQQLQVLSDTLNNLLRGASNLREEVYGTLSDVVKSFSQWPRDKMIPVMDSLRVFMISETFAQKILSEQNADMFISNLLSIASGSGSAAHGMLAFRILSNAMLNKYCATIVYQNREQTLECGTRLYESHQHKNLRIAVTSFIVNTCIYCRDSESFFEDSIQMCTLIHKLLSLQQGNESESVFRLLVALGTLISGRDDTIAFTRSLEFPTLISEIEGRATEEKVKGCASQLSSIILSSS